MSFLISFVIANIFVLPFAYAACAFVAGNWKLSASHLPRDHGDRVGIIVFYIIAVFIFAIMICASS